MTRTFIIAALAATVSTASFAGPNVQHLLEGDGADRALAQHILSGDIDATVSSKSVSDVDAGFVSALEQGDGAERALAGFVSETGVNAGVTTTEASPAFIQALLQGDGAERALAKKLIAN